MMKREHEMKLAIWLTQLLKTGKATQPENFATAKVARKLYHALSCPSVPALKNLIRSRLMRNCSVTTEDVDIAERIFDVDVGTLKGKTTRKKSVPPVHALLTIPPELDCYQDIELCVDVTHFNEIPLLVTICKHLQRRTAKRIVNCGITKHDDFLTVLNDVL